MAATLQVLGEEKVAGRRIAVLGTMRELGRGQRRVPRRAGRAARGGAGRLCDPRRRRRWRRLAKALGGQVKMAHVPDAATAIPACARGDRPRRRDARQGIQLDRTCRPRRGAGGRDGLMFLWIAEQLGYPGVFNLFRYITLPRRRGDRDRLVPRPADRPEVHRLAAGPPGQGPADPRRRPAVPPRQARHADHGRADDPDLADRVDAAVDGLLQPLSVGLPADHRRLRRDRLPRRLRQGQEAPPQGRFRPGAAARRVRRRRHRLLDHLLGRRGPSSTSPSTTGR